MGKRTSYEAGTFSWAELATTDVADAKRFYGGLLGWEFEDVPVPESEPYSLARVEGDRVAGLTPQQPQQRDAGIPPHWFNYVTVASADETAELAKELGGTVHAGPFDVMEQGRMAVIADPTGAMFGIWEPRANIGAERVNDPGTLTWNDLATNDPEAASAFYSDLFGWSINKLDTDEGQPSYWQLGHEGAASGRNGGMRELTPEEEGVPPNWMAYFAVESVDETLSRAQGLGGSTVFGPLDVPAGRFAALHDGQGAVFSVVEAEFDE